MANEGKREQMQHLLDDSQWTTASSTYTVRVVMDPEGWRAVYGSPEHRPLGESQSEALKRIREEKD